MPPQLNPQHNTCYQPYKKKTPYHTLSIPYTIHQPKYGTSTTTTYTTRNHTYNTYINQHITKNNPTPPTPLINNITHINNFHYITHTHQKSPKIKIIQYNSWNNSAFLLIDIQLNLGPTSSILENLPQEYTQRQNQYFLLNYWPKN